jgi:hypothetical protein
MTKNEHFGLVFTKTGSINSSTGLEDAPSCRLDHYTHKILFNMDTGKIRTHALGVTNL